MEKTWRTDDAMLLYFSEHRPHTEPFDDFNEITLDTGVACVTRQDDGTLLVDSPEHKTTMAQWQRRIHINYRAWISSHNTVFKATLHTRFCRNGENHIAWVFANKFDDVAYIWSNTRNNKSKISRATMIAVDTRGMPTQVI